MKIDIFYDDQKGYINSVASAVSRSELTKEFFLEEINFAIAITRDEQMKGFLNDIKTKMDSMSADDWKYMIGLLPFELLSTIDDDVSEVPEDAYDENYSFVKY